MEIKFNDQDRRYAEAINEAIEKGEECPVHLSDGKGTYYLKIECTDIGKANAFIMNFMQPNEDRVKKLEEQTGIRILSANYSIFSKLKEISKDAVQQFVEYDNLKRWEKW